VADRTVTGAQRGDPGMRVIASAADPMAELARLRRPSGPWLHLLDGAPSDARQLGWMLTQDGMVVRILRGHCVRTSYGLFDEAAAALQLPGDPVEDWPTLAGLLTDMSWLPGSGHLLVVTRASLLLAAEQPSNVDGFVLAVREVARGRAEEGDPVSFHVVLQDDTTGLAALRPRLEAAGARYDELSGWDAEEPFAESAGSARVGYTRGQPALDAADAAVVSVLSTWDGVVEVRRAWETFRGPDTARVRMYLPVLAEIPAGPVLRGIVGAVSIAARNAGAVGLAMPMPANEARREPRQQEAFAGSVPLWPTPEPVPEPVPEPEPARVAATAAARGESGEPIAPAGRGAGEPAAAEIVEPDAGRAGPDAPGGDQAPAPQLPTLPGAAEPAATSPADTPRPSDVDAAIARGGADSADPSTVDSGADSEIPVGQTDEGAASTPSEVEAQPAAVPYDDPAAAFELVAANLEWDFAAGADEPDTVDTALIRHAGTSGRLVGLFRTWVKDPGGGWVRVVMQYVGTGSIADVETERSTAVDLLRRAGGKRCCVEVVGASDVSDVHEWLRERSVPLWTAQPKVPAPRTAPDPESTAPAPTDPAPSHPAPTGPAPTDPAPADPERAAAWPADIPSVASPTWPADIPSVSPPAPPPPPPTPASSTSDTPLPDTATFQPGPDDTDAIVRLLDWAPDQQGLIGLVSAWTDLDGARTLVIGTVMEPDADHAALHAAATALVQGTARTESIVPAKGLPPMLLRLYRSSTRLWTRKVKREAAATAPGQYKSGDVSGVSGAISNVFGDTVVREDVELPGGFTIVAIDAETKVRKGQSEPDWTDAAVVASVQGEPHLLAAVRGTAKRGDADLPVYGILVDETADRAAIRGAVAAVIAEGGSKHAAIEVFCPFERVDVLHLNIYENSLLLWKRERQEAPPAEADGAPPDDAV
jgi:hypothetical protein